MSNPKLALIPSGYKSGKVYSILPNDATGDFDFDRASEGTRVRKDGLIEEVTNDVPRLDWLNSNCPSLLLESQRTNLLNYSEDYSQSQWIKIRSTISTDQSIAPNGTFTADKIIASTDNNTHRCDQAITLTDAETYTLSFFAKESEYNCIRASIGQGGATFGNVASFNLNTKTVSTTGTIENAEILDFGNGWFRCISTMQAGVADRVVIGIGIDDSYSFIGDNSSGLFMWGAMIEQASYSSSYIKTEASTVTRVKDDCHVLNHTLFTDYPFTVYAKAKIEDVGNTIFSIYGGASNKYLAFLLPSSGITVAVYRRDATNNDSDFYNFTYSVGDTIKVAVAFINDTTYKLYINGTEIGDVTSGLSVPFDHDDILLGQFRISGDDGKRNSFDDFRVYDYTLTDVELTELTT